MRRRRRREKGRVVSDWVGGYSGRGAGGRLCAMIDEANIL